MRHIESLAIYAGLPALLAFLPGWAGRRWGIRLHGWVIPVLLAASAIALWRMKRSGLLVRGETTRIRGVPGREWFRMLARFAACASLLAVLLAWLHPEWLLAFPRENPRFWLLVCVAYPLLSVLPQGVLYRALWEKRYAATLSRTASLVIGAAFFSWAHIVFHNAWACAFTFVGGLFFLSSYRRTGSLMFSAIEHALYGDFLFTIGWGAFFYEGTQAALRAIATAQ